MPLPGMPLKWTQMNVCTQIGWRQEESVGNQNIDDRLQQRAISDAASHYHASVFCSVQGNAPLPTDQPLSLCAPAPTDLLPLLGQHGS